MERSNLESSANSKVSQALTCETDASKKKVKKKGGKRGRRFDRDCRAAELEVCCLILYLVLYDMSIAVYPPL